MTGIKAIMRCFPTAAIAVSSLLLSGCFMVERSEDGTNGGVIAPNGAHPLGSGPVRICDSAGTECRGWYMEKSGYGYSLSAPDTEEFTVLMRPLKGPGIPSQTYLVETYSSNVMFAGTYTLNLAIRQVDGAWLVYHPDCEWAVEQGHLAELPWVTEAYDTTCRIARAGLTDQRFYETLRKATPEEGKFRLYQGS